MGRAETAVYFAGPEHSDTHNQYYIRGFEREWTSLEPAVAAAVYFADTGPRGDRCVHPLGPRGHSRRPMGRNGYGRTCGNVVAVAVVHMC